MWDLSTYVHIVALVQDEMLAGVNERVVRIEAQDVEQLMRAVALIITKLSENPDYARNTNSSTVYAATDAPSTGRGTTKVKADEQVGLGMRHMGVTDAQQFPKDDSM